MELVSLTIERFGCITHRSIAFKPGLNVLHGANEVGKSSIARAIRFALLVPPTSSAAEPWIPWSGAGDPAVTLVFRKGSAEHYRVVKQFGSNTALLERSSDGNGWVKLASGREVEARLRSLLEWGIPEPGGANAQRGVPESFLASALLADQDHVAGIFERDLESDGVDSGCARVRTAVQAMSQDPLFKEVLEVVQARVDEAFTPSGKFKRGARDPLKKIADEIVLKRRERDEAAQTVEQSRALAQRLSDLQRDTANAESELQERHSQCEALERRRMKQLALATASVARKTGQSRIDAVNEATAKVQAAVDRLGELEPTIPGLRQTEDEARKVFEAATADASAAREKRKSELAQEEASILRERDALRSRQAGVARALDLRKADDLRRKATEAETGLQKLDSDIAVLQGLEPWMALRTERDTLEAASRRERKVAELLAKAADCRARAAAEWPGATSQLMPDAKRMKALSNLRHALDKAEIALDVGLSVEVRGASSVKVSVDDAAPQTKSSPFAVEAKRFAQLELGNGVEVVVRGGLASDRGEAERLRKKWDSETVGLFAAIGVADFSALEDACRLDAEKKSQAEALMREAATSDAERVGMGTPSAEKEHSAARIAELLRRLEGADGALIEAAAKVHGTRWRAVLTQKSAERDVLRSELSTHRANEAALRERAATQGVDEIADVDAEERALSQATMDLDLRERKLIGERQLLSVPPAAASALETALTKATASVQKTLAAITAAASDRESWSARLQERRATADCINLEGLLRDEVSARAAAGNEGPVDEVVIAQARNALEVARGRHDSLVATLRRAEGALLASEGASADEKLSEFNAALERAQEKQAALEDDYEEWRLLAGTLKSAERSQATHLGKVFAPDLAARLQALTGQRYSGLALSPHLKLEGVESAGARRELDRLSIGTREQFSTLFRLCLAERLQSALLLDDQLVQSDPDRLRWFRGALRQTATAGVQIIVLTCRPDDYLEPAEYPSPNVIELKLL